MTPIQQLYLGVGAKKKTYLDDVFSTYAYPGEADAYSTQTIVNNIDLATEGGMVWIKNRNSAQRSIIGGSVIGDNKYISSCETDAVATNDSRFKELTTTGFKVGGNNKTGLAGENYVSWSFRKAPGFFDVVNYTGNGDNARAISHSLGSVPGMVIVKALNDSSPWTVYHKEIGSSKYLYLNDTAASGTDEWWGEGATFTASNFYVQGTRTNANNTTFVAYVFAGGESTASTARSVDFDGTGDTLTLASSSDFNFGTGDFTFEGWLKPNNNTDFQIFLNWGSDNPSIGISNDNNSYIYYNSTVNTKIAGIAAVGQWTHYAISRSSGTTRLFLNGELKNSFSDSHNYGAQALSIGGYSNETFNWNGRISNVRIVKGTALYTSSFRPSTVPFTNITNTKLLCCNNSVTSGSTVTPGTISVGGNPQASTDSPFDDQSGFVFGESGSESVIKTGSFKTDGNGEATVNIGWEPSFVMMKRSDGGAGWYMFDSIRAFPVEGDSERLSANNTDAESEMSNYNVVSSSGFSVNGINTNSTHVFIAIRRPDGYVGKPAELGTGAFNVANYDSTAPAFNANFPVDFAIFKRTTSTYDWRTSARLINKKYLKTTTTDAESTENDYVFDYNNGWNLQQGYANNEVSWMWKRHAGFDVVCYEGTQTVQDIKHSLNKAPEMMWIKNRDSSTYNWSVYHSGLGDNRFKLYLNTNDSYSNDQAAWNNTAPTSTHFTLGTDATANHSGSSYIAMLFASYPGISAVGNYTGNGSTTGPVITTGFSPRLIMIKRTDDSGGWFLYDTLRGITSGNDHRIQLEENSGQSSGADDVDVLSTGFQLKHTWNNLNGSGGNYIYYAHA